MAEPEPLHLDPTSLNESSDGISVGDISNDSSSNSSHSSTSAIINNLMTDASEDIPEFELEEETEEDCEFELEEPVNETSDSDHVDVLAIVSAEDTNQLTGEFDAKTLENLLTETEEGEEFKDITELNVSDTPSPCELSEDDSLVQTIAEKDSSNQALEKGTLKDMLPEPKLEDKMEFTVAESESAAPKNSDYSDDILSSSLPVSFEHSKETKETAINFNQTPPFINEKTIVTNNTITTLSSSYPDSDDSERKTAFHEKTDLHEKTVLDEKIDLDEIIEHEHSVGTLHQQQVQNLEMSLLERVDDLIGVLENKHKSGNRPEQLPHKQFATGIHYIKFEKNHYLGGKWLRKAAMQGHAKAQLYLGMLFVQGNGVPKSMFHAYAWFSLAACQDIAEAVDARKKLEPRLTAKEINASLRYAADLLDKIHNF